MSASIIARLSAAALILVSGSALGEEQTLKFRLITTEVDGASFEAPGEAGHELSTWRSVGVAVFEDGRIAYKSFVVTIDSAGETGNYSGYSTYTFENGDALTLSFTGGWGENGEGGDYEVISGTGAFEGATGTGRFDGVDDPWEDAYLSEGSFTLNLPNN